MQELLLKAVEVALIRDKDDPYTDSDSSILIYRKPNTYKYEPTDLMRDIVKEIGTQDMLEPLAREIVEFIKDNYKSMVQEKKHISTRTQRKHGTGEQKND